MVFARSEETHARAMAEISESLTVTKAIETLQHSSVMNASTLKPFANLLTAKALRSEHNLNGFGGLDGARRLLNEMIEEGMEKYDAEIARCTAYYAKQCALMETARGQISAANFVAATSRSLILDAEYNIKKCEISIPETKQELKDHNRKCKDELAALDKRLKVIMGDIAVMTMILKMSDCDAKLIQTEKLMMLRCKDQCTKKRFVTFDHDRLQKQVKQLQSPAAQDLLAETFADLFNHDDDEDDDSVDESLLQTSNASKKQAFNRPPVPMTKVPGNPCIDPNKGAPSAEDKRAAKCTLKKSPRCYKLQQRFLIIQAGLEDDRDALMEQIDKLKADCLETQKSLEASIETDNSLLSSSQTKLAAATEKEATAGETGRQVAKENQAYNDDLVKQMKTCSNNYIAFEAELCALKKIRGDLFKKYGKPYFF